MNPRKIQPPFVRAGDEVAIISPSYHIDEKLLIEAAAFIEKWGLRVRIGKKASKQNGPFAGSDDERLSDLQEMTDNPDIKAVFCSRGGYGFSRIIGRVDFSALNEKPKWYCGFSDATILNIWLNEVCGVMSVHGEMPLNFNNPKKTTGTFISLKEALFGDLLSHEWSGNIYNPGSASGEITGGNLSLLYSLSGSKGEISTEGKILFIEDVGECFYHIDRMLSSLKLAGKMEGLSALIVGGMTDIDEGKEPWGKNVEETILDIAGKYNYPLIFNFPAGHIPDNRSIYIGREAVIEIKGNAVTLRYV